MASVDDIAAMKIGAIVDNGTRMKDFVDVAKVSETLSVREMIDGYMYEYGDTNRMIAYKALTYFDDVIDETIVSLDSGLSWESVKVQLRNSVGRRC